MSTTGTPGVGETDFPIPVTVYDDDPLTRAGLTCLLSSSPLVDLCDPDRRGDPPGRVAVVLTDRVAGPVLTGLRGLSRTHRVVLIVARLSEPQLLCALDSGVSAILFRHQVTRERLLAAVRAAARDDRQLPGGAVDRLVDAVKRLRDQPADVRDGAHPPTERELAVLRLLADGLETREIAERLRISERTVKNVLHGITARFQLRNRTHAVSYALREGHL